MAYLSTKRPPESKIHDKALGSRKSSTILAAVLSCMLCDMAANTIKLARNGRDIIPHFPCVDLIQGVKRVRAASPWSECYLKRGNCDSASSERELLVHKLMCIVMSAVWIALCRAIRVVCLYDVSMIAIGVEGADQGEEEPSHHHVAPGMSLPQQPSQQ
jgi:hypothetical protein